MSGPKIIAFEGEFAMTEGHAQELKTQALALQVGKRLRVMFSDNNAGIDDSLLGGVIASKYDHYSLVDQWTSYGWNVFTLDDGNDYDQVVAALKTMEDWDPKDRRPMVVIGKTVKGYWPYASHGKISGHHEQIIGYPSHPYALKMNSDYFVALAKTFEDQYGVEFVGIRQGAVTDPRERLIQFKANIDVAMSVLERNGLGDWLADRLVAIGDTVKDDSQTCTFRREARSVPGRSPARRQSSGGTAKGHRQESHLGRREAGRASRSSASPAKLPARAAASRKLSSG